MILLFLVRNGYTMVVSVNSRIVTQIARFANCWHDFAVANSFSMVFTQTKAFQILDKEHSTCHIGFGYGAEVMSAVEIDLWIFRAQNK
jgi:hypothetical protein